MSVELINDCVVIPHLCDWSQAPQEINQYPKVSVVRSATGAEDRSTGGAQMHRSFEYRVLTFSARDRAKLTARILEALKRGRACIPYWARPQRLLPLVSEPLIWQPSGGSFTCAVTNGRLYHWTPLPTDLALNYGDPDHLANRRGYFTAQTDTLVMFAYSLLNPPGPVQEVRLDDVRAEGLWPWQAGDYAFFICPEIRDRGHCDVQRSVLINSGGTASGNYADDQFGSGGTSVITIAAIDTARVIGFPVPPAPVYQTARNLASDSPGEIVYVIPNLEPGVACRLRLHFAEIEPGFDRSAHRRVFDIEVQGATAETPGLPPAQTIRAFEPYREAGHALNKAVIVDFVVMPSDEGEVTAKLTPTAPLPVKCRSTGNWDLNFIIFNPDGVNVTTGDLVLLMNQHDPTENGIWRVNLLEDEGSLYHERVYFEHHDVIQVQEGEDYGGTFWRVRYEGPETDTNEALWHLNFAALAKEFVSESLPYACGINAVELYQYSWEVRQLAAGTGTNRLVLDGWLRGVYPAGQGVYPVIFGTPSVASHEAVTGQNSAVRLKVAEPLGAGPLAISACPVKVCEGGGPWDPDGVERPLFPGDPRGDAPGGCNQEGYSGDFGPNSLPLAYGSVDGKPPIHELSDAIIRAWTSLVVADVLERYPNLTNLRAQWVYNSPGGSYLNAAAYAFDRTIIPFSGGPFAYGVWEIKVLGCLPD